MRPPLNAIRGIRFEGAGLGERMGSATGLVITPASTLAFVTGGDAVRQSIMLLLTTSPGERVMRPDYGCPLNRLVFAPNDATTAGLAIHYVRQAILRWEPRVELAHVDAGADPEAPGRLVVSLSYRIRTTGELQNLELGIGLDGGNA
jgi:phage baseplate assembly protein W